MSWYARIKLITLKNQLVLEDSQMKPLVYDEPTMNLICIFQLMAAKYQYYLIQCIKMLYND